MKAVTDFLERSADVHFLQDEQGRTLFLPAFFGRGRLVPDNARKVQLRRSAGLSTGVTLLSLIPVIAALLGLLQPRGWWISLVLMIFLSVGQLATAYLMWICRDLELSDQRRGLFGATSTTRENSGTAFLKIGLVGCLLLAGGGAAMLVVNGASASANPTGTGFSALFFGSTAIVSWLALRSRRANSRS